MRDTREELSRARKRISSLFAERSKIERRLLKSGELLKESFFEQYRKCGKAGCRCERGERHGPYPYLVVGKGQARRLTYVSALDYPEIKKRSVRSKEFEAGMTRLKQIDGDIKAGLNDIRRILEKS